MTSRTSYFKSFEDDYYIEKPSGHKLLSEQIKVEKELNEKLTRKMTIRLISKFDISLLNHVPNCNLKIIKNKIIY